MQSSKAFGKHSKREQKEQDSEKGRGAQGSRVDVGWGVDKGTGIKGEQSPPKIVHIEGISYNTAALTEASVPFFFCFLSNI